MVVVDARAAWLEARRRGIGGTDAAAILGLSPWATPLTVWLDKRGELKPRDDAEAEWLWWGRNLEDLLARRYCETTGRQVFNPGKILEHREHPFLIGTPDRLCMNERRGLDLKTARRDDGWGAPGTDDIPAVYVAQMCHYMAVTDYDRWDVAVLVGGSDFRVYTLERDREFEAAMVAQLVAWWQHHVVGGERPEIDSSQAVRSWLSDRYPGDDGPMLQGSAGANAIAAELARARTAVDQWTERKLLCENRLKEMIGDAAGITGDGWRATWRRTRGRQSTDWEGLCSHLADRLAEAGFFKTPEARVQLEQQFIERDAGHRRFTFTQRTSGGVSGDQ
jgi:putative phage-type endonuclease